MIILKQVLPEEWEKVLEIKNSVKSPMYASCTTKEEVQDYLKTSKVYFILDGEQVIGLTSFEIKEDGSYYINGMIILSEYRGKKYSLEAVKVLLDTIGAGKHVHLVVHPHNAPAIIAYLKAGFVISGWKDNYFGDGEPRVGMIK